MSGMLFHILNRGVDKRDIVLSDEDRVRFVHDMFVFNNKVSVNPNHRFAKQEPVRGKREVLVDIHAWCIMNNHYHMLVSPKADALENISLVMRKLNMGFAKFFNEKYGRSGVLWQGVFKKIEIKRDGHFLHIPDYIHLNPLDYTHYGWRDGDIVNTSLALETLEQYRWSSLPDYLGTKNFPSILTQHTLRPVLGSPGAYKKHLSKVMSRNISVQNLARICDYLE